MERRKGQQSIYRLERIQKLKERAHELYKQGLTVRDIAKEVRRSPAWVWKIKQQIGWDEIALQNEDK